MNGRERPTAPTTGDVSLECLSASASRASFSEDGRWQRGYRVEACACGGQIVLYLGEKVVDVVGNHNVTPLHSAWRMRH